MALVTNLNLDGKITALTNRIDTMKIAILDDMYSRACLIAYCWDRETFMRIDRICKFTLLLLIPIIWLDYNCSIVKIFLLSLSFTMKNTALNNQQRYQICSKTQNKF